ncbi:putative homogentisate phytyltransferase chloroplastic [Micractinium conductrix]|uniref:Homogentisate phytyltransferase chloroplastic n=1 Tax=Micractinium conductrix TaxID=554055 RepID=A0A2P6V846_9CHLO|nr:putative homogentisate phytyltransferase chloroplastic [Micractinium conductrix]|eukprot:PSC70256.1 putative homogentisate phytyltransferase chloroplastic [Micractinium conductrix]
MLGTAVSVCSVSALALAPGQAGTVAATALAQALSSALLMNICIVGINQLYDIEIDRVNKPYLPLAAGDWSLGTARGVVAATGAAALAIGVAAGSPPLLATLAGSLTLGIAYSTDLPFLRWKRSPVLAAACILSVRAILVQLGFFWHMQLALGAATPVLTRPIAFATAFMLAFSVVIALFKDVPDVAGDSQAGVRTLSVRMGPKRVFWICIALLEAAYAGAILVGLQSELLWSRAATTAAHACLGALLMWRARRTDLSSPKEISKCYMWTWGLFYSEYLLLPLFR